MNQVAKVIDPAKVPDNRKDAIAILTTNIEDMTPKFKAALPVQIPTERFKRCVLTALNRNPDLLGCRPMSIFNAALLAAQDGLLPDGREAAFVKYGTDCQYLPMIGGILKKVRNSGELKSIMARCVHNMDEFHYWIDEEGEHIRHVPALKEAGAVERAYAMALTKDGGVYIEVMTVDDIEQVRAMSRAKKSGPWFDWWEEMAKKTVLRRLSKRLPMSSDLDDLIRRDDFLYDIEGKAREVKEDEGKPQLPQNTAAMLDHFASDEEDGDDARNSEKTETQDRGQAGDTADTETGEIRDAAPDKPAEPAQPAAQQNPPAQVKEAEPAEQAAEDDGGASEITPADRAYEIGTQACAEGKSLMWVPDDLRGNPDLIAAYKDGWKAEEKRLKEREA